MMPPVSLWIYNKGAEFIQLTVCMYIKRGQ